MTADRDQWNDEPDSATKCPHCDATDSYNFNQCISCGEQE